MDPQILLLFAAGFIDGKILNQPKKVCNLFLTDFRILHRNLYVYLITTRCYYLIPSFEKTGFSYIHKFCFLAKFITF